MDVKVLVDSRRIVQASGEITYSNVSTLNAALKEAVHESPEGFVIDLSGVTYLDSAGIQAIFTAYRKLRNTGGSIVLVVAHPNVKEILDTVSIDKFPGLFVSDSVDAAEELLGGKK